MSRETADPRLIVAALFQLGVLAANQGEAEEADRLARETVELSRNFGDLLGLCRGLITQAMVAVLRSDYGTLRAVAEDGLISARNLRRPGVMALFLEAFGALAAGEKRFEDSIRLVATAAHALEDVRAVMSPMWIAAVEHFAGAPAREAIGDEAYSEAWSQGFAMGGA